MSVIIGALGTVQQSPGKKAGRAAKLRKQLEVGTIHRLTENK